MSTTSEKENPVSERRSAKLSAVNDEAVNAMAFASGKSKTELLNEDIVKPWRLQNEAAINRILRSKARIAVTQ
jgi:hypothetical protein